MRKQAARGVPGGKADILMARLVDRPANSQALKVNNALYRKPVVLNNSQRQGDQSTPTQVFIALSLS